MGGAGSSYVELVALMEDALGPRRKNLKLSRKSLEHDAQLLFKRAKSSESLLGGPSFHREKLARQLRL